MVTAVNAGVHEAHDVSTAGLGAPRLTEVAGGVVAQVRPDGSWWITNTGLLVRRAEGQNGALRATARLDSAGVEVP